MTDRHDEHLPRLIDDSVPAGAARQEGVERFDDIRVAVLESNGRVSFFARDPEPQGAPEPPNAG